MSTILAAEVGTTSTTVMIIQGGVILTSASSKEYHPTTKKGGYSRQNPKVWWDAFCQAVDIAVHKVGIQIRQEIDCIVVGGQMHGLVPNGTDLANLWNDSTAVKQSEILLQLADSQARLGLVGKKGLLNHTGNIPSPNLTALKLMQMADEEPNKFKGLKCFTLPAGAITKKLIGEAVIDPSDASGTMLWDIQGRKWSEQMIQLVGIPNRLLPRVVESLEVAGKLGTKVASQLGLNAGISVLAGGADQSESALGMGVIPSNEGIISFTMGTSGVITAALAEARPDARLNTFAHVRGMITFLCTNACGDAQRFIRDMLGIKSYAMMDELASEVPVGSNGVMFTPLLSGSRMLDCYRPNGHLLGMSMSTTQADICRAVQEGIIMEAGMGLDVMREKDIPVKEVRLGGGGAKSDHLAQMVADILGVTVVVPEVTETTVLGAGIRGTVAMGDFGSIEEACTSLVKPAKSFKPRKGKHDAYAKPYEEFSNVMRLVTAESLD